MDPRQQKRLNAMKYSDVSHNTPALRWDQIRFIQGEPLTAQQAIDRKHLVVLELWATWCPPCRQAIPLINQLQHHIAKEGVQVIGITAEDDEAHVKKFIAKMGNDMTYRVAIDEQCQMDEWRERFNCPGIPFAFIIDWTGTIRWAGNPMIPAFINKLKSLLDERDATPSTKPVATPTVSAATGGALAATQLRAMSDDELKAKPVKELITLLKNAQIDVSGCLEKSEFIDRLRGKATI